MASKKLKIFVLVTCLLLGLAGGSLYEFQNRILTQRFTPKNNHVSLLLEVYDTIQKNYWDKLSEEQLNNLYLLGAEKLTGKPLADKPKDKRGLQRILTRIIKKINQEEKKKEFTTTLADIVLANLQPFGRSRLYSQKEETNLQNRVENKNPEVNQYQVLGVEKNAPAEEIQKTYEKKQEELKQEKTPEAQQKLAQLNNAYKVLADTDNRKVYDQSGVEPTMEYKLLRPEIFYIHITKFAPTTIDELVRVTGKVDAGETLNSLILDLRDNVGGTIDGLPYFIGPFIGNDQYAYQFYHQGEKIDYKTKIGWLPSLLRYKKVVVLLNGGTQSTAEVMAATLKKYNVGVSVGTTSKGWGTVEKVFEIKQQIDPKEKYSVFLVHSLTLRDDGQPIEGKGVEPVINLQSPGWEKQLLAYFNYPEMVKAIKEAITP